MKHHKVFILIALLFSLTSGNAAQTEAGVTVIERCGTEQEFTGKQGFWSVTGSQSPTVAEVKRDTLTIATSLTPAISSPSLPFSTPVLYDGAVLMSLVDPGSPGPDGGTLSSFNRDLVINTTDARFANVTIPDTPDGLNWWLLLPETAPGQFGIFGWRPLENAFILPVTLTEQNGFTFGEPQTLPFDYYPNGSQRYGLSVSLDWRYIASIRYLPELKKEEYFIYSITDSQFIWRTAYDGDGIPNIFWLPQGSPLVAIVTNTVREQKGVFVGVYADGSEKILVDFNTIFGGKVDAVYGMGVAPDQIVFLLTSLDEPRQWEGYKLLMFAADTGQIIDFCQPGYIQLPIPSEDGRYVLFGNLVENRGEVRLVELVTGNYSDIRSGSDYMAPIGDMLFELKAQDR